MKILPYISIATVLLSYALPCATAQAQGDGEKYPSEPVSVAVLQIAGPHRTLSKNISALLTANLSTDERFSVVDRTALEKILEEQAMGTSGMINPETAARIGQLTGAKVLITGREMLPTQNSLIIIVNVVSAETGRVVSHTEEGRRADLVGVVARLSARIGQTISEQAARLAPAAVETANVPERKREPLTVAVYDFAVVGGDARDFGPKITGLLNVELSRNPGLVTVERAALDKALSEQALGLSGNINAEAAARVGQLTGARVLISGQTFKTAPDRLVIIANIVGTETSRLYAEKVEGDPAAITSLTSQLAEKISDVIATQMDHLVVTTEPRAARIARIVDGLTGTRRPSVRVEISDRLPGGELRRNFTVENQFGIVLQQTGFVVVDEQSKIRPDVEIVGRTSVDWATARGNLQSCRATVEVKVTERSDGRILLVDRQESTAVDVGRHASAKAAQELAVDGLAARILPVLAREH